MHLSASAIKDYLECPQKFEYRLQKAEAEPNAYFVRGIAVHETLEQEDIVTAQEAKGYFFKLFSTLVEEQKPEFPYRLNFTKMVVQSNQMLENYYNKINVNEPPIKETELFFNVVVNDIEYVGKIDQIRGNSVYDWKTTIKSLDKYTRLADYQFTLYGLAYKELYGELPEHIYYGHLYEGKLHDLKRTEEDYEYLESVAGQIIFSVENDIFPRAYGKYRCGFCQYKHLCFGKNGKIRY